MFFGCFNLCLNSSRIDNIIREDNDENVALFPNNKKSIIKIIDRECSNKLPIPTDKEGLAKLIKQINSNFKSIADTHYEFRITNPNEPAIRNDSYVRYKLEVYNTKIGMVQYDLYLIISIDITNNTTIFLKSAHNLVKMNMSDWMLLENIFRTCGFIAILENVNFNTMK